MAFEKACFYFDLEMRYVDTQADGSIDLDELVEKIDANTICLIASCPSFPNGIVDPVEHMSQISQKYKIGLHIDACLGGFVVGYH